MVDISKVIRNCSLVVLLAVCWAAPTMRADSVTRVDVCELPHCAAGTVPHENEDHDDCRDIIMDPQQDDPDEFCAEECRLSGYDAGDAHGGQMEFCTTGFDAYCGCYDLGGS